MHFDTHIEFPVTVYFDYQPAEPENNVQEGVEINSVEMMDGLLRHEVLSFLSNIDLNDLALQAIEHVRAEKAKREEE